jgi:RNA polymerase sigma factor (sigma-70 family)
MTRPSQVGLPGHPGPPARPAVADRIAAARAVFDGLWERHHAAIYGYCCHLTDEHRGADLTRDVFLDAYRALLEGRFDGRSERAWLFTNATRKALDRRRLGWGRFVRGSLERLFPEYFWPRFEDGARPCPGGALRPAHQRAGEAALTAPARTAQPERVCAIEEERATVAAAVRRLRPSHRAVLWLREWQGMDYDQIGRVLGISRASTKAMLWRARTRFREEWLRQEART